MPLYSKLIYFGVIFIYGAFYGAFTQLDSAFKYTYLVITSILTAVLYLSMED